MSYNEYNIPRDLLLRIFRESYKGMDTVRNMIKIKKELNYEYTSIDPYIKRIERY